jgi:tight adherence protein C
MNGLTLTGMDGLVGLAGACALIAAGAILAVGSRTSRSERLAPRIALAQAPSAANADAAPLSHAVGPRSYRPPSGRLTPESREVIRRLAAVGVRAEVALAAYRLGRLALAICMGAVTFLLALRFIPIPSATTIALLAGAVAMLVGWMAPSAYVGRLVKSRTARVAAGLPDAIELLVVCIEAGLALEDGIDRIVIELRASQPALAEELALTSADWKILPSREQALANLAERVDVPSVRSVVTTLSQTLRYGTPLVNALRSLSIELRDDSLLRIEERANQLPVMLTIPMMIFIMPTIFLIVAGPAALKIYDLFLKGRMF